MSPYNTVGKNTAEEKQPRSNSNFGSKQQISIVTHFTQILIVIQIWGLIFKTS